MERRRQGRKMGNDKEKDESLKKCVSRTRISAVKMKLGWITESPEDHILECSGNL